MTAGADRRPPFPAEIPTPPTLVELHSVMVRCTRCTLSESRIQVVPGSGPADAELMFIGEAPGAREDELGEPFVGRSGALLDEMLASAGIDRSQVFIANIIRCRPPENRNPRTREVRACRGWLQEQLRLIRPALVAPLGRFALQHLVPGASVTRLQGELLAIGEGRTAIDLYPLLHPSAILRNANLKEGYREQFSRIPGLLDTLRAG